MSIDQIRDILNNYQNLSWDPESKKNFIDHLKALNLDLVDGELREKVTAFLATEDIGNSALQQPIVANEITTPTATMDATNQVGQVTQPPIFESSIPNNSAPASVDVLNVENNQPLNETAAAPANSNFEPEQLSPINQSAAISSSEPSLTNAETPPAMNVPESFIQQDPINTVPTDISESAPAEKPKKKSNMLLILIALLLVLGAVIYYVIISLNKDDEGNDNDDNNNNPIVETVKMTCVQEGNDPDINALLKADFSFDFSAEKNLNTATGTLSLTFDSADEYTTFKNGFEAIKENFLASLNATEDRLTWDDTNYVLIVNVERTLQQIKEVETDHPESYDDVKTYYLNQGYTCDGEQGTKQDESSVGKLFSITEKVNVTNNFFEYTALGFGNYNSSLGFVTISGTAMKNISGSTQVPNIHIKLYDANKQVIGDYQYKGDITVTENTFVTIAAGATQVPTYNIYDDYLNAGKKFTDAAYFSIENILAQ